MLSAEARRKVQKHEPGSQAMSSIHCDFVMHSSLPMFVELDHQIAVPSARRLSDHRSIWRCPKNRTRGVPGVNRIGWVPVSFGVNMLLGASDGTMVGDSNEDGVQVALLGLATAGATMRDAPRHPWGSAFRSLLSEGWSQ